MMPTNAVYYDVGIGNSCSHRILIPHIVPDRHYLMMVQQMPHKPECVHVSVGATSTCIIGSRKYFLEHYMQQLMNKGIEHANHQ